MIADLAARRRFGVKPGLETIRAVCAALGNPERRFAAIHVAGTNGKGAVVATLDACLRAVGNRRVGRYTSPHLVRVNERFFLDGVPISDDVLEEADLAISPALADVGEVTFFEALTALAYRLYADARVDYAVLECGLGGRLDATNVCSPALTVITRIGLDHCDWLGNTIEKIAAEKAGIIKEGVPIVLGENEPSVRAVIADRARELGAPFFYAPDIAAEADVPAAYALGGTFNRENAVTSLAALRILFKNDADALTRACTGFARVVWPGRFQRVGDVIIDGAHNPPAARALARSLAEMPRTPRALIAGFCGDKDVDAVLKILAPYVTRGYAVKTNNPRSLAADETAAKMRAAGLDAAPCDSLAEALALAGPAIVCGSLFLAGEALVALNAYPWSDTPRFDPEEQFKRL